MKNFDHQWPVDLEDCKGAAAYFASGDIYYAVCLKPSMKLIGFIAYNSVTDKGILDLGHVWHTVYQDNDHDTEALSLMTQYAFEKLGVNGVTAGNPLNCKEQIAPLKALGMEVVEIRKKASFVNDENGNPIEFTGCKMLITREKWEASNHEGYSLKHKPEILCMVEENAGKVRVAKSHEVRTANGGSYIDGIPMLKWGEWRDNTYCGCITALLNATGVPVSYEEEHHKFGYDAYDILIQGFELGKAEYQAKCGCDQYHIGSMQDARSAAYKYLNVSVDLLYGENKVKLLETTKIYKKMLENLLSAVPYEKTTAVFNYNSAPVWDVTQRCELVIALKENKKLEKQARVIVKDILDNWDS